MLCFGIRRWRAHAAVVAAALVASSMGYEKGKHPDETEAVELDDYDMDNAALAIKGAGITHKYNCAESVDGYEYSCDLDKATGNIEHIADWSFNCDPWKDKVWANDTSCGHNVTFTYNGWTCPPELRSPSGCGDFRTDPRNLMCTKAVTLDPTGTERVLIEVAEPLVPQKHACVQHPLFYDNYNTAGAVTPPIVGRHRERWPKWGEYDYIPPQRWLHASEHGGIIFLYHHCLDEASLCRLRTFIKKWQKKCEDGEYDGGKFRFIMTPARNLQRYFGMITWGEIYLSSSFNENEMDTFINLHYRRAWEDVSMDGAYDYLWAAPTGLKENDNCNGNVAAARQMPPPIQRWEVDALNRSRLADFAELLELRKEQTTLKGLAAGAVGLSASSLLVLAAVICWLRPFLKLRGHALFQVLPQDPHTATGYTEGSFTESPPASNRALHAPHASNRALQLDIDVDDVEGGDA